VGGYWGRERPAPGRTPAVQAWRLDRGAI